MKKASFSMLQLISMAMRTNVDSSDEDNFLPELLMELDNITIIALSRMIVMMQKQKHVLTTTGITKSSCVASSIGENRRHMTLLLLKRPRSTLAMVSGIMRDP